MHRIITTILIFLAFSTLLAQSLEITDFQRVDSDLSARVTAPKMDNYGKPMALLKISTALTGVSVTGTGLCEVEAHTGELWVFVNEGTFNIKVAVKGYERLVYPLPETAKSATVYRMKLRGEKVADQIPISFITKPEDAEKWLDGELLGTGESFSVAPGNYALEVRKGGYQTYHKTITVDEHNVLFKDISLLVSMPAVVKIDSDPQGATVYIDNLKFGTTPTESFFDSGTYPIRIELQNHETIEEQINITEPETRKNYTLTDIRASITVKTNPEARVIFDGKTYPGGIDNLTVLPRTIQLRVEQDYCEAIVDTYTLANGENKVFEIYPDDIAVTLTVKTNPNATIRFNDQEFKGGVEHYKIMPQVLTISVEYPHADIITQTQSLRAKEQVVIELYPEIATGTIQILTIPTNANWELKDELGECSAGIGRAIIMDAPIGSYELKTTAKGYKTHLETLILNEDETILKQIQLEPGSDLKNGDVVNSASGIAMIYVEGGTFQLGTVEQQAYELTLDEFFIGKSEITRAQYKAIMGAHPANSEYDNTPNSFSWYDAIEYCNAISLKEGYKPCYTISKGKKDPMNENKDDKLKWIVQCDFNANGYRLPTEAEWEFAARGGNLSHGYKFSGGYIQDTAWCRRNSGEIYVYGLAFAKFMHEVETRKSNELGIYDMSGNSWEWCWDWYGAYNLEDHTNPRGPRSGQHRVMRGGSCFFEDEFCTVSYRGSEVPSTNREDYSIRVCRKARIERD